ncbi:deaminase/reductase [Pseudonocardia sp. EC080625-04]|uniref:RibD family protein n=1 Tax=unclassified Pseudonocardia TaxID=2619320 RepID=UPI0006CB53F2|nr:MULTISPECIES: dihydrofolate reductase family protein [unclassified Pseudonocardia]ALE75352.1 deaminase/reductase [Pseudonocardia sp. EC080625-04]
MTRGRPYVLASVAMSLDGYIDDAGPATLVLSDAVDLDRVDGVRAEVDAVLVGAGTVRNDDPRLLVRSDRRRAERVAAGRAPSPLRVVLAAAGADLDPSATVFTVDAPARPLVYASGAAVPRLRARLGAVADVADGGDPPDPAAVVADLARRGVRRLLVEGGGVVHTAFLTAGLVDELHVVVAPFFVGDPRAPRFVHDGGFPQGPGAPMELVEARPIGDLVLLHYRVRPPVTG